jgi:hypothetical protein
MEIVSNYLLTFILFSPVVVAVILMLLPRDQENLIRWVAFILSFIPLGLSIALWLGFNSEQPGFQYQEQAIWYAPINSSYHLGVDGISLTMVLVDHLLTSAGYPGFVRHYGPCKSIYGVIPDAGNWNAGRFSFLGSAAVLRLLGNWPGSNVFLDQPVG